MTERMIENRIKKLKAIEAQIKELEAQAESVKKELKTDLDEKGLEEIKTEKGFVVRWKKMFQSSFDTKSFKADHEAEYQRFLKRTECRRFEVKEA